MTNRPRNHINPHPGYDPFYSSRHVKRAERKMGIDNEVYQAWLAGQEAAEETVAPANPYPPGYRHGEWQRGFDLTNLVIGKAGR